jgi:hypothetical protein
MAIEEEDVGATSGSIWKASGENHPSGIETRELSGRIREGEHKIHALATLGVVISPVTWAHFVSPRSHLFQTT